MKKRDYSLDVLRILSIFLVVVIHVSNYYNRNITDYAGSSYIFAAIYNAVARVSVPVFFMISGALVLNKPMPMEKLKSKILHFVMILVVWTVIYYLFMTLYEGTSYTTAQLVGVLFEPLSKHLWFMYAIIALYLIIPFAHLLVANMDEKQENYFLILWIIFTGGVSLLKIALAGAGFSFEINYDVPLVQTPYYFGYFISGNILYKRIKNGNLKKRNGLYISCLVAMLAVMSVATVVMSIYKHRFVNTFLTYRNLPTVIASLLLFILIVQNVEIKNEKFAVKLGKISANTFGVYLLHIIPLKMIYLNMDLLSINGIFIPIIALVVFIISYFFVWILSFIPVVKEIVK